MIQISINFFVGLDSLGIDISNMGILWIVISKTISVK